MPSFEAQSIAKKEAVPFAQNLGKLLCQPNNGETMFIQVNDNDLVNLNLAAKVFVEIDGSKHPISYAFVSAEGKSLGSLDKGKVSPQVWDESVDKIKNYN